LAGCILTHAAPLGKIGELWKQPGFMSFSDQCIDWFLFQKIPVKLDGVKFRTNNYNQIFGKPIIGLPNVGTIFSTTKKFLSFLCLVDTLSFFVIANPLLNAR